MFVRFLRYFGTMSPPAAYWSTEEEVTLNNALMTAKMSFDGHIDVIKFTVIFKLAHFQSSLAVLLSMVSVRHINWS